MLYNGVHGASQDGTPVSTSTFILELQAGEKVQIVGGAGSTMIYGVNGGTSVHRSWFSGFLLSAL